MKKSLFVFILIILFKVSLVASYKDALDLYQEKDYKGSLKILAQELNVAEDMIPSAPNYKQRFLAAHNHWKLGNTSSVIAHFSRCMVIKKDSVEPYIDLALYQVELKRYNDAEATIRKGLRIKKSPMLYFVLGKISLNRKNYWRAKELFEKTNSLDPELYMSYNALGIALMNLKKYSEANTAFSIALNIKPDEPYVLNNTGMSFEKMGKKKEALEYYIKADSYNIYNKTIKNNIQRLKQISD